MDIVLDCRLIRESMGFLNIRERADCVALVDTILRAAIADKMFGCGDYVIMVKKLVAVRLSLQAAQNSCAQIGHKIWVFRIAFIGPPPTVILRYCQRWREHPIKRCGFDLARCDRADVAHQLRVTRRA